MRRWTSAAVAACGVGCAGLLVVPPVLGSSVAAAASAPAASVRVSPTHDLVAGQAVHISGRGLALTAGGAVLTWFVVECTSAVQGRMNPENDTDHCDVTGARRIRVAHNGSFATTFHVVTGIVGDGYCGTPGHLSCVLAVSTASGRGTVTRIGFKAPTPAPSAPPAPAPTTSSTGTPWSAPPPTPSTS
jgi:hypothetical protein